jgi:hypothetical protein
MLDDNDNSYDDRNKYVVVSAPRKWNDFAVMVVGSLT